MDDEAGQPRPERPGRLSRAEVDALYAAMRRDDPPTVMPGLTPAGVRSTPPPPSRPAPTSPPSPAPRPMTRSVTRPAPRSTAGGLAPRSRRYLGVLGALVLAVLLSLVRHGFAGAADPDQVLGGVPAHPTDYGDHDYAWMQTQPGSADAPVGYNPCKQIPVEINYAGATPDILALTQLTMQQINQASGLHLAYVGASQHFRRTQGTTGRILISFNDLSHDSSLVDAAGIGGSSYYLQTPSGVTKYFVGGSITLNSAEFNHYSHHDQALVLAHEFGHAIGLDHVDGAHQVMSPGDYSVTSWGEGDLTALARLGRIPCQ